MYFPKPKLGKSFSAKTKPDDVTNVSRTFGAKTLRNGALYELVFPKISPKKVNADFIAYHDRKVISHGRYLPSERINRHYKSPPFNPNNTYGKITECNKDGLKVKRCLEECNSTMVISQVQKDFLERTKGALGKKIKNMSCHVDENMTMGHPRRQDPCDAKSLIENLNTCQRNTAVLDAKVHLNKLRRLIFKRPDLHINDIMLGLQEQDTLNIGYLPLGSILKVTGQLYLHLDAQKIHTALEHFQMLRDAGLPTECVDYREFCKLLQVQFPLPTIRTNIDEAANAYHKDTTYMSLCKDSLSQRPEELPLGSPRTQRRNIIEKRIKMGNTTTAKILTAPDIPMSYGLEPSDFEIPRSKEDLYRIFKSLLCEVKFNEVWQHAIEVYDASDNLLTVNEIRSAMNVVLGRSSSETVQSKIQRRHAVALPLKQSEKHDPPVRKKEKTPTSKEAPSIDMQAGGDVPMEDEKKPSNT